MSKIKLPVTWECSGFVEVEADSVEDAIKYFNKNSDHIPLPNNFGYTDGSFELSSDDVKYIELLQNTTSIPMKTNNIGAEMVKRMFQNLND